ncbi:MAG TPA: alpha-glucosidase [Steroidobacteraceae bacterium]|jgi:alpha-glucosidase
MSAFPWWRGAVIYQIYPRSFLDSNGDGVGDLAGIGARLDYVAALGVDAIWVSPFFKSPMADFGYDIADFRAVDPLFGDLTDFDRLVTEAHARGLKVMIDQVMSHTSTQHPWFLESRSSRDNPKADWYVWADPASDGSPPNNWQSIFGGPAWRWEPRRRQYYLHNFLDAQPDLNFHHPRVPAAMLQNLEFWLQRGVDGLRLDAINFCYHDRLLRNNPPKPAHLRNGRGFTADNPYAYQYHWYNNTQPENLGFLTELRRLLDRYPGTVGLGEISSEDSLATMAEYIGESRLHMAYSFELLTEDYRAAHIRSTVESLERQMPHGWPCWTISNHDVARVMTRWGGAAGSPKMSSMLNAMVCSLRGSVCIYQGEELGLPEAGLPYEALRDPYGIAFWPNFKGRDGCRTPMPWRDTPDAGFTTGRPWLPVPPEHLPLAVSRQEADRDSPLHAFRRFLRWRSAQPALCRGDIGFIETPEPLLAFTRTLDSQSILAAFNLSDRPQAAALPALGPITALHDHGLSAGKVVGRELELPPHGVFFARVAQEQRAELG